MAYRFEVERDSISESRVVQIDDAPDVVLRTGQVLIEVQQFALTSNNVTYALVGEDLGYWSYFSEDGPWGVIPAWGTGRVKASEHPGVSVGEMYFGFFPMSSHLLVSPSEISNDGFNDNSPNRASLHPIYNWYTRFESAILSSGVEHSRRAVFRPFFFTALAMCHYLGRTGLADADAILVSSASSKTALCIAHQLRRRLQRPTIGLTSAGNLGFVEKTGLYDQVFGYQDTIEADVSGILVYIDVAGNEGLVEKIRTDTVCTRIQRVRVGLTHREVVKESVNAPDDCFFFAPDEMKLLMATDSAKHTHNDVEAAWQELVDDLSTSVRIVTRHGPDDLQRTYLEVLNRSEAASAMVVVNCAR